MIGVLWNQGFKAQNGREGGGVGGVMGEEGDRKVDFLQEIWCVVFPDDNQ